MSESTVYNLVVIGGGPAGITIAKRLGKKMKVAVIRPEDHSMIYCAMPYAIEGLIPFEKTLKKDMLVTEAGADLIRDTATAVNFDEKTVTLEKGGYIKFEKLIIATGANPVLPPIDGADLKGVYTFKTEDDLRMLMELVEKGLKKAVVVGAGAIGIELSQALNEKGIETHLVDMADSVLPNLLDRDMSENLHSVLTDHGIKLHLMSRVQNVSGSVKAEKVILNDGNSIQIAAYDNNSNDSLEGIVVFAVGMKPAVDMFKDSKLEIGTDGIIINEYMETNIPDVYAVGDCAQYTSGITGEVLSGKLATNAVPMAKVVADNLLGKKRKYTGFYNGAATKISKYYAGSTGLSEAAAGKRGDYLTGFSEMTIKFPIMPEAGKATVKLIADSETLEILGGQIVSEAPVTDKIDTLTLAIQNHMTVENLRDLSYSAQPYQSFFPANNLFVAASEEILKKKP